MLLGNNLKLYKTNSALGYNQYAYLLESIDGYLVVDAIGCYGDDTYTIGKFIHNIDSYDLYLEETEYKIEDSPLWNTFLFQFFIRNAWN
jgi:hypothetical protein